AARRQLVRHALGAVSELAAPLSHSSVPSTMPLPQSGPPSQVMLLTALQSMVQVSMPPGNPSISQLVLNAVPSHASPASITPLPHRVLVSGPMSEMPSAVSVVSVTSMGSFFPLSSAHPTQRENNRAASKAKRERGFCMWVLRQRSIKGGRYQRLRARTNRRGETCCRRRQPPVSTGWLRHHSPYEPT